MSACAAAGSTHSKTESHVFTQRASAHGGSGLGATGASRRHSTRECLRLGVGTVLRTQEEESHLVTIRRKTGRVTQGIVFIHRLATLSVYCRFSLSLSLRSPQSPVSRFFESFEQDVKTNNFRQKRRRRKRGAPDTARKKGATQAPVTLPNNQKQPEPEAPLSQKLSRSSAEAEVLVVVAVEQVEALRLVDPARAGEGG